MKYVKPIRFQNKFDYLFAFDSETEYIMVNSESLLNDEPIKLRRHGSKVECAYSRLKINLAIFCFEKRVILIIPWIKWL